MRLRLGCRLSYRLPQPTPMIALLNVHFSRFGEQPGIQFRRVDAGLPEQVAYPPPCCAHAECQEIPSMAASCAAWFSVISAEISSSSASPAITLSSL